MAQASLQVESAEFVHIVQQSRGLRGSIALDPDEIVEAHSD